MTTRIKHLYVHVPFCRSICHYCDFARIVYDRDLADRWLDRLEKDIKDNCSDRYETIYIGGGTPSCLSDEQLERLLAMTAPFSHEVKEFTIEVNPESLDLNKIALFKRYGIGRVSMGVQSADDGLLEVLNRKHAFSDVVRAVSLLKENGLDEISIDLMYSLPGQDMDILKDTLQKILELDVPHVSLYSLTIEEGSVFGKKGVKPLDEETEADMYDLIEKTLVENGYVHYEISNYARPGHMSKHNLGYWEYEDFLGVSCGAAGKIGNVRYTNTSSIRRYISSADIREEDLTLSREDMMFEHVMMSLRTMYGLDIERFERLYGVSMTETYPHILTDERLQISDGRLICRTPAILNRVLLPFLERSEKDR